MDYLLRTGATLHFPLLVDDHCWNVAPCSRVEIERRKRLIVLMMEAVITSEMSVSCETTRRNIPEDSHLHIRHPENLTSHLLRLIHIAHSAGC
jgi:hypothetical protein